MKAFDPNYKLLDEIYQDDYYPAFLVDKVKDELQKVIDLLENGETDPEVVQETLDEAVCGINDLQEEFDENDSEIETVARDYLEPLRQEGLDTLILGCTHYPIISDVISMVMGKGVSLISSGGEAGKYAYKMLQENGLLRDSGGRGKVTLYCTDSVELFRENAEHFLDGLDRVELKIQSCRLE